MDQQNVLSKLIWDLQSFLLVLDSENLSYIAQAQKKSICELLNQLHTQTHNPAVEDAEYMIMSCPSSSPSNELMDTPGTGSESTWSELPSDSSVWPRNESPAVPPHPPGGLRGDDDEDEDEDEDDDEDDDDDDTYEEAEPYIPDINTNTEEAESDSTHYESYGNNDDEDEEGEGLMKDRANYIQWSASQPCLRPAPEWRLCGYLWRRKWLGQWTKQLFIIRNATLTSYKCAQDLLPQMELDLRGCQLTYKSKNNNKIQHQLKLVLLGSDSLVLGYHSFQQADEWRKVIQEVSVSGADWSGIRSDQILSFRSSAVQTVSQVDHHCVDAGFLNVLMNCQWQSLLCRVDAGLLNMFAHRDDQGGDSRGACPQYTVQLRGCDIKAGPDTDHSYRITLSMLGDQVAVLEVNTSEQKQRWFQLLQDGAANHGNHDDHRRDPTGGSVSPPHSGWFPSANAYMDDPFHLSGPVQDPPIYSNTSTLETILLDSTHSVRSSSVSTADSVTYSNTVFTCNNRKPAEAQRCVQKLDLTGQKVVQRAGSEVNLASSRKHNKRSSFRQSLAVCTERAQVGFLNPLLRRTASTKTLLRRAPSLFIEHGKVFQRTKEWETKAAA